MDIDWLMKNYRVLSRSHKQVRSFSSAKKGCQIYKISRQSSSPKAVQ